jgi:anti-sigma B factor antagonist
MKPGLEIVFLTGHDVRMNGTDSADAGIDKPIVSVRQLCGAIVVEVTGEIDMVTAPLLENAVRESLASRPDALVIDLSGAQFFSSAGIAVLVLAHRNSAGISLRVVAQDRVVLRPLELTGLTEDLAIYPDLDTALAG